MCSKVERKGAQQQTYAENAGWAVQGYVTKRYLEAQDIVVALPGGVLHI